MALQDDDLPSRAEVTRASAASPAPTQPDSAVTLRIPRVQELTLTAVLSAAVGFGIWMGTLNTKLERLEKFADKAEDGSTGLFIRLATIEKSVDRLEAVSVGGPRRETDGRSQSAGDRVILTNQGPDFLGRLMDYRFAEKWIRLGDQAGQETPSGTHPNTAPAAAPKSPDLNADQADAFGNVKASYLDELDKMEEDVGNDRTIPIETESRLIRLIDAERQKIKSLKE